MYGKERNSRIIDGSSPFVWACVDFAWYIQHCLMTDESSRIYINFSRSFFVRTYIYDHMGCARDNCASWGDGALCGLCFSCVTFAARDNSILKMVINSTRPSTLCVFVLFVVKKVFCGNFALAIKSEFRLQSGDSNANAWRQCVYVFECVRLTDILMTNLKKKKFRNVWGEGLIAT